MTTDATLEGAPDLGADGVGRDRQPLAAEFFRPRYRVPAAVGPVLVGIWPARRGRPPTSCKRRLRKPASSLRTCWRRSSGSATRRQRILIPPFRFDRPAQPSFKTVCFLKKRLYQARVLVRIWKWIPPPCGNSTPEDWDQIGRGIWKRLDQKVASRLLQPAPSEARGEETVRSC